MASLRDWLVPDGDGLLPRADGTRRLGRSRGPCHAPGRRCRFRTQCDACGCVWFGYKNQGMAKIKLTRAGAVLAGLSIRRTAPVAAVVAWVNTRPGELAGKRMASPCGCACPNGAPADVGKASRRVQHHPRWPLCIVRGLPGQVHREPHHPHGASTPGTERRARCGCSRHGWRQTRPARRMRCTSNLAGAKKLREDQNREGDVC